MSSNPILNNNRTYCDKCKKVRLTLGTTCKECGSTLIVRPISSVTETEMKITLGVVVGLFVLLIGSCSVMVANQSSSSSSTSSAEVQKEKPKDEYPFDEMGEHGGDAYICAEQAVKQRLQSPSTAEFEWFGFHDSVEHLGFDKYSIDSYVDSENGFGAKIRTYFECEVQLERDGACDVSCKFKE